MALGLEREIDHHDRILFHDADEKNDSDDRHDGQFVAVEDSITNRLTSAVNLATVALRFSRNFRRS